MKPLSTWAGLKLSIACWGREKEVGGRQEEGGRRRREERGGREIVS